MNSIIVEQTSRVVCCTMEYMWNKWVRWTYLGNDGEKYTVVEWVESFIHDGLVPEMKKRGYVFPTNEQGIVNSFLNFIFHFQNSYNSKKKCQYIGKHGRKMDWSIDDYSYFLDNKCPQFVWDKLLENFPIEHFSDESEFSKKLWSEIPSAVFFMLDLKNSPATEELEERLAWLDSDDEDEGWQQRKKNNIDPYLLDYGKDRYKYAESDSHI
jgi:hypothetical protein